MAEYNFQNLKAELIIRDAFKLLSIPTGMITGEQLEDAIRGLNFILSDWNNRNVNLWTLKEFYINLQPGVVDYILPPSIFQVMQCLRRELLRQNNGGTAHSYNDDGTADGGGNAAACFGDNPLLFCQQNVPDGYISYTYPNPNTISFVGIKTNEDGLFHFSFDGLVIENGVEVWVNLIEINQTFTRGNTEWFRVTMPLGYNGYRVKIHDGATMNMQKLYFCNGIQDILMSQISYYDYMSYPVKYQLSMPSVWAMNYYKQPQLTIWGAPNVNWRLLIIRASTNIAPIQSATEAVDIIPAFYNALIYGIATRLAPQLGNISPEAIGMLNAEYQNNLAIAISKNNIDLPFSLGIYNN